MSKEKEAERRGDVLKLCIINHVQHELYLDAIPMAVLENDYEGDEETFLKKMYGFTEEELKEGYVTWDWINTMQAYGLATDAVTTSYFNKI